MISSICKSQYHSYSMFGSLPISFSSRFLALNHQLSQLLYRNSKNSLISFIFKSWRQSYRSLLSHCFLQVWPLVYLHQNLLGRSYSVGAWALPAPYRIRPGRWVSGTCMLFRGFLCPRGLRSAAPVLTQVCSGPGLPLC